MEHLCVLATEFAPVVGTLIVVVSVLHNQTSFMLAAMGVCDPPDGGDGLGPEVAERRPVGSWCAIHAGGRSGSQDEARPERSFWWRAGNNGA